MSYHHAKCYKPKKIEDLNIHKSKNVLDIQIIPNLPHNAWVECYKNTYDVEAQNGVAEAQAEIESVKSQQILKEKREKLELFQKEVAKRVNVLQKLKKREEALQKIKRIEDEHNIVVQRTLGLNVPYKGTAENLQKLNKELLQSCIIPSSHDEKLISLEEVEESNNKLEEVASNIKEGSTKARHNLLSKKIEGDLTLLPGGLWLDQKPRKEKDTSVSIYPRKKNLVNWPVPDTWSGTDTIKAEINHLQKSNNKNINAKQCCDNLHKPEICVEPDLENDCSQLIGPFQKKLIYDGVRTGKHAEDEKVKRENQYWKYRRIFMDIERDQVRTKRQTMEQRRQIERLKIKKENDRRHIESKTSHFSVNESSSTQPSRVIMTYVTFSRKKGTLQDVDVKNQNNTENIAVKIPSCGTAEKEKELRRYIEALRDVARKRIELKEITIPALCCCGPTIWDAHPDTCANNCLFYNNPKEYIKALTTALKNHR